MAETPTTWKPIPISDLPAHLPGFKNWVLCGGYSVALIVGKDTREHGDVDIGIFRSEAEDCLRAIGAGRVFLCENKRHRPWDGSAIPKTVHDVWVTDRKHRFWAFQVMIFDDEGDQVIFRRDRRIRWPKRRHSIRIGDLSVLNPFVTFLFKAHKATLEEKEVQDLISLIERGAELASAVDGAGLHDDGKTDGG